MKLEEKVIENRLREETRMVENQFDFMSKRSTTEVIYLWQSLTQRYRNKETYIWFLLTWKRLIIHAIQNKYEVVTTSMRTPSGEIKDYPIETGLHHGLRLESLLV